MRALALFLLVGAALQAREMPVADAEALKAAAAAARPGDVLVLRAGEWRDVELVFEARGTAQAPVTLRAAVPGRTVITGTSTLRIGGTYGVVEGLHFRNPDSSVSDLIQFRLDAKRPAQHARLTACAITSDARQDSSLESRWIGLYGRGHRIDHCRIEGKTGKGTTLVVWLDGQPGGEPPRHRIDHNHFGPREKLGKNGGETIRVGDSKTSMQTAACVIEENLFERCNGEVECISNKSCGNIYRRNTFLGVSGTLTLRHGNACVVEDNLFDGCHEKGTGGIRIIGEDHVVRGNHLQNLAGGDLRSALTLMLGIPASPLHGYFQVKRARIEGNTTRDCASPIRIGAEGSTVERRPSLPPLECLFAGNRVQAPAATVVTASGDLAGVRWEGNEFHGQALGLPPLPGIAWQVPQLPAAPQALTVREVGPAWWP